MLRLLETTSTERKAVLDTNVIATQRGWSAEHREDVSTWLANGADGRGRAVIPLRVLAEMAKLAARDELAALLDPDDKKARQRAEAKSRRARGLWGEPAQLLDLPEVQWACHTSGGTADLCGTAGTPRLMERSPKGCEPGDADLEIAHFVRELCRAGHDAALRTADTGLRRAANRLGVPLIGQLGSTVPPTSPVGPVSSPGPRRRDVGWLGKPVHLLTAPAAAALLKGGLRPSGLGGGRELVVLSSTLVLAAQKAVLHPEAPGGAAPSPAVLAARLARLTAVLCGERLEDGGLVHVLPTPPVVYRSVADRYLSPSTALRHSLLRDELQVLDMHSALTLACATWLGSKGCDVNLVAAGPVADADGAASAAPSWRAAGALDAVSSACLVQSHRPGVRHLSTRARPLDLDELLRRHRP